ETFQAATGAEVVLHLVVPAVGLALQGQARAAELCRAGGISEVAVEGIGIEVDAAANRGFELLVGRGDLDSALGGQGRRAGRHLVQVFLGGDVDVRLRVGARF